MRKLEICLFLVLGSSFLAQASEFRPCNSSAACPVNTYCGDSNICECELGYLSSNATALCDYRQKSQSTAVALTSTYQQFFFGMGDFYAENRIWGIVPVILNVLEITGLIIGGTKYGSASSLPYTERIAVGEAQKAWWSSFIRYGTLSWLALLVANFVRAEIFYIGNFVNDGFGHALKAW